MKHTVLKFAAIACAMLFGACSSDKEIVEPAAPQTPEEELVKVEFGAATPETRAQIEVDEAAGKFLCSWDGEDRITVFANQQTPAAFTYNPSTKFFEGYLKSSTDTSWNYQAVLPYMATNPLNIPFGAVRTQRGNQFNAQYYPLISERVMSEGSIGKDDKGNPVVFKFRSPTAILALTFTTADAKISAEKVQSIELQMAGSPIAAESFDLNRISMDGKLSANATSQKITMNYEAGTEPSATLARAYFNVPAGNYTDLKVVIATEKHTAEMTLAPAVSLAKGELVYATREITQWASKAAAPTMSWQENPSFARQEITDQMNIHINAQAEAGIRSFEVKITSQALAGVLPFFGFTQVGTDSNTFALDLASDNPNPNIMQMLFGDPAPTTLKGKTENIAMDLSGLVPMINTLENNVGDHKFTITIEDNADRKLVKVLTFFVTPKPSATVSNINLWKNTASVTLENTPQNAVVQYKRQSQTQWQNATGSGKQFTIEPQWNAGSKTSTLNRNTGVFAGENYQWQVKSDNEVLTSGSFTTTQGDVIPTLRDGGLSCYTLSNENTPFWGSGNNKNAKKLCTYSADYAHLQAGAALGMFLTPGNLFSGTFTMSGMNGSVSFGKKYTYTARPSAIRVDYKAEIGTVNSTQHKKGNAFPIEKGAQDEASIMVAIIDWSAPHVTTSGMGTPSGVWSPETMEGLSPEELNGLIAYGVKYIKTGSDTSLEIPLNFYKKTASAPAGNYTIIISCATSRWGDYLCGCSKNTLDVRNFEWVY